MIWAGTLFGMGMVYGQWMEWFLHKNLMHNLGKKRGSRFGYHFHTHHRVARQNLFRDDSYLGEGEGMKKELGDLFALNLLHLPLLFVLPWFTAGAVVQLLLYFFVHRHSHLNPEWCKHHLPWHYDHHMALNQDANWGVTTDWVDRLMGTRVVYLGTEKEERDTLRRLQMSS
jgi:sterol desaturase/sphingolipid hydroxylase (fatty acid hydroxylase superfamily)